MLVSAVIVSYNRPDKLKISLFNLLKTKIFKIYLIDNNSTEQTKEVIKSFASPILEVTYLSENIGASAAFKLGIKQSLKDSDLQYIDDAYTLFLDDDSFIADDFLENLSCLKVKGDYYASKVINLNNERLAMNRPVVKAPINLRNSYVYFKERRIYGNETDVTKVDAASFVGLVVRNQTLAQCQSYLIEELFIYCDDLIFTYSMTLNGKIGLYQPTLNVYHDTNDQRRIANPEIFFYLIRNTQCLYRLFSPKIWYINYTLFICSYLISLIKKRSLISYFPTLLRGIYLGARLYKTKNNELKWHK